jgi:hypothetical protein
MVHIGVDWESLDWEAAELKFRQLTKFRVLVDVGR